jgi:heme exporter protein A
MPQSPQNQIRFDGVSRRFGRLSVLAGVTGEVADGEVLLVTGSNGSGKSTLLKCLAGLLVPDKGKIESREAGQSQSPVERRRRVGLVAPDLAFYEELTTAENLTFFGRLRGVPPSRGAELLARVGLPADRLSGALSSGMRQRLRWCWALLHRPRLLLLDEPFQNLDAPGETVTRELLDEHLAAGGLAVVANPASLPVSHVAARLELGR